VSIGGKTPEGGYSKGSEWWNTPLRPPISPNKPDAIFLISLRTLGTLNWSFLLFFTSTPLIYPPTPFCRQNRAQSSFVGKHFSDKCFVCVFWKDRPSAVFFRQSRAKYADMVVFIFICARGLQRLNQAVRRRRDTFRGQLQRIDPGDRPCIYFQRTS